MKARSRETTVCKCPYCATPVESDSFFCQPCRVKLVPCADCGKPRAETVARCPHCGSTRRARARRGT